MEIPFDALLSALLSGGITSFVAKTLIGKSIRELEQISEKVSEIKAELSAIGVKLKNSEKDRDFVMAHERKIAAMENEIYGHRKKDLSVSPFPG